MEIAYNGRWGMLCDSRFSTTDAESVCQGLGYDRSDARMMSLSSARYSSSIVSTVMCVLDLYKFISSQILESESNLKPIWLTELTCSSSDSSLVGCISEENVIGFTDCRSFDIAAVDCGKCWN